MSGSSGVARERSRSRDAAHTRSNGGLGDFSDEEGFFEAVCLYINSKHIDFPEHWHGLFAWHRTDVAAPSAVCRHWRVVDASDFVVKCFWYMAPDPYDDRPPYLGLRSGAVLVPQVMKAANRLLRGALDERARHLIVASLGSIHGYYTRSSELEDRPSFRPDDEVLADLWRSIDSHGTCCPYCGCRCGVTIHMCTQLVADVCRCADPDSVAGRAWWLTPGGNQTEPRHVSMPGPRGRP